MHEINGLLWGKEGRISNSYICSLIGKYNTGGFAFEREKKIKNIYIFEKKVTCMTRK